ncbi:MAG: hypothetical protein A3H35_01930 [Betaproteobacteria bacterium RIFCSPLOWO2_02_FULL_62_17]|nr:MAG: hypothetical protein A3H35_01930 [Betaproteobacteria bacterium RIFCSPLOWO2_02_FULL_62_17]
MKAEVTRTGASDLAAVLKQLGVRRVFGLCAGCRGVERRLQLAHHGRTTATDLPDIRYDRIGEVLGALASHVDDPEQLDRAVDEPVAATGPAVLNVAIQRDAGRMRFE